MNVNNIVRQQRNINCIDSKPTETETFLNYRRFEHLQLKQNFLKGTFSMNSFDKKRLTKKYVRKISNQNPGQNKF